MEYVAERVSGDRHSERFKDDPNVETYLMDLTLQAKMTHLDALVVRNHAAFAAFACTKQLANMKKQSLVCTVRSKLLPFPNCHHALTVRFSLNLSRVLLFTAHQPLGCKGDEACRWGKGGGHADGGREEGMLCACWSRAAASISHVVTLSLLTVPAPCSLAHFCRIGLLACQVPHVGFFATRNIEPLEELTYLRTDEGPKRTSERNCTASPGTCPNESQFFTCPLVPTFIPIFIKHANLYLKADRRASRRELHFRAQIKKRKLFGSTTGPKAIRQATECKPIKPPRSLESFPDRTANPPGPPRAYPTRSMALRGGRGME